MSSLPPSLDPSALLRQKSNATAVQDASAHYANQLIAGHKFVSGGMFGKVRYVWVTPSLDHIKWSKVKDDKSAESADASSISAVKTVSGKNPR